jgi:hypothetical protein
MGLALAALLVVLPATGQVVTGVLTGTVTDQTDAVVPGAKVTVTDLATGQVFTASTDSAGNFSISNLPQGFYRVVIEAQGFAKFVVERVQVFVGQTSKVTAQLKVAEVGTEIVVTGQQAIVNTETAEVKASVDRAQIMNLPLPTRNPLDLVRSMPGIVTPTSSGIADAFVHGLRGNSTNLTQDGINVADNFVKTSSFFAISAPTVDAVGEFAVSVGAVGVDGGFGAAQVSIRTQRGSDEFHGSAYWYQRTNALNANTWFNNAQNIPRPFQLQNRIGANAGGPVFIPGLYDGRSKTWVFGNIELFREPLSRSRTRSVLTPSARQGLFTWTPPGGSPQTINLLTIGQINGPSGSRASTPADLNQAVMNFYNSLVPEPNGDLGCGGDGVNIRCFTFNLPGKSKQERYTIRADHQLSKNHSLEFVYNQADFDSTPDLLNGIEPMFPNSKGGAQTSRRQVAVWAWHATFGTNKANEFRTGFQRAPVQFNLFEDYSATGGVQLDYPLVTDPTLVQGNLPQGRNTPVRQVMDHFSWYRGSHGIRFGGEYKQVVANSFFFNTVVPRVFLGTNSSNPNGVTSSDFPGGISSGDLSRAQNIYNILVGQLAQIQQGFNHTSPTSGFVPGVPRTIDPIQHNLAFYIQDQWKMFRNFTLTAGVRYEYQGVFDIRNGLVLLPQDGISGLWGPAGVGNLFTPRSTPVLNDVLLNFAGSTNGKPIYDPDVNNFAPYVGFAWDPWSNGKTSIRGGATIHYTQDGFTLFQLAGTGNTGLFSVVANSTPVGVFNPSSVPLPPAPVASFPVSQRQNFINNTGSNLWVFDPNLRTPVVIEWSLSVGRELWNRWAIEARYVGNHASGLFRSTDYNQINLLNNPFTCPASLSSACGTASVANLLTEFLNAANNLAICSANRVACTGSATGALRFNNVGLPGQVPLPIFSALFQGLPTSSGFQNSTFITLLTQGQVGSMMDTIRRSNTYRANREAFFPLNFFVPNPFANSSILVDNSSWSIYHGGELEVTRRFANGLFFQANYTFSKVLTDTTFLTSQQEFQTYRDLANRARDRFRAAFDVRHSFSMNFLYPLPFGRGKWLGSNVNPILNKFIGGWSVNGFTRWSSGAPFTVFSGRVTTGAFIGEPAVLRNMTPEEFAKQIGVFRTARGVFWLNPDSGLVTLNPDGSSSAVLCTPGQTTPCFDHPAAGQNGNMPWLGFDLPRFFNQDLSIIKETAIPSISERFNFQIRFEFFNAFNVPNFTGASNNIDNSNFGQLTSQVDTVRGGGVTSRIIQWVVRINW